MNFNPICVYDFETCARDKNECQIIEIAAMIIHSRKLEIVDKFVMTVRPDYGAPGCLEETLEWHAKQRNVSVADFKKTLDNAPGADVAWPAFTKWVDKYNFGKPGPNSFKAPIPCGYNTEGFDDAITDRYCNKYGPVAMSKFVGRELPRLFNQVYSFDLMKHMWFWFENIEVGAKHELANLKLETIARYMGFSEDTLGGTHCADTDVLITAKIVIKLLKMQRYMTGFKPEDENGKQKRRLEMKDCFVDGD